MNVKVNKVLIKKYLDGKCSEEELQLVRAFLKEDNAQKLFDQVWDEAWTAYSDPEAGQQQMQAWKNSMHQKIASDSIPEETAIHGGIFNNRNILRYAAILAFLFVGAGFWVLKNEARPDLVQLAYVEKNNPAGRRTIIVLPDGSQAHLGPGSQLRYAEKFTGNTREISLKGEAYFEVIKNKHKPFIIHTGNVATRVLGTTFKVNAFDGQPVSVMVSTGKVRVDRTVGSKLEAIAVLAPGETVTWDEKKLRKTLDKSEISDISGWKDGRLVFNQTRLGAITEILERWYDVDIDFKNPKKAERIMKINLTANVPINTIMKILGATGQFSYKIKGRNIIIK